VFIKHGLQHWLNQTRKKELVIFEVGFGTGLNAWLTHAMTRDEQLQVTYFSVEAFPLQREVWTQLNYAPGDAAFTWLHEAPWNVPVVRDDGFTLCKIQGKLEEVAPPEGIDVVYFDAFAPSKQPHLWTHEMLGKVCRALSPDGVFVTYCARGQLKRDLRALGLQVETLPGPPGKKEMVRARLLPGE
jgi:tRNA U34 5-methylaminomethyl-2-thiouridine-forming methyltransferase MnmC